MTRTFEKVYANTTTDGTPVYIYVPVGAVDDPTRGQRRTRQFDHNPGDEFTPCADKTPRPVLMTAEQIEALGDELTDQIVAVDEAHYGEIGLADPADPDERRARPARLQRPGRVVLRLRGQRPTPPATSPRSTSTTPG